MGALSGGLAGLALAAGLWGPDAIGLWPAHEPLLYASLLIGATGVLVLGVLAGWLAARSGRLLVGAALWLAMAVLAALIAGHLPFEGLTLLVWLADRRFWGLPIYPFDFSAQTRLEVGGFFPVLVLTALGIVQDFRLEGVNSARNARGPNARAWLLLLLPLPVVFGAGLAADDIVNSVLRDPAAMVAQIIQVGRSYPGDLDALSRQTGLNYSAIIGVRANLSDRYRLMLGDIDLGDDKTVIVVAQFDNGAWINCRVLVDRVSFCDDARPPYTQGLQSLLAGQDISQCQDCQVQVSPEWQAWLQDHGRFTGSAQITRLAQWGSAVLMRAANPGSGYALECLFQGNRTVSLVWCKEKG